MGKKDRKMKTIYAVSLLVMAAISFSPQWYGTTKEVWIGSLSASLIINPRKLKLKT